MLLTVDNESKDTTDHRSTANGTQDAETSGSTTDHRCTSANTSTAANSSTSTTASTTASAATVQLRYGFTGVRWVPNKHKDKFNPNMYIGELTAKRDMGLCAHAFIWREQCPKGADYRCAAPHHLCSDPASTHSQCRIGQSCRRVFRRVGRRRTRNSLLQKVSSFAHVHI